MSEHLKKKHFLCPKVNRPRLNLIRSCDATFNELSLLRVFSDESKISLTGAHDPILGQSGQLHLEAGPKSLMIEANIAGKRPR